MEFKMNAVIHLGNNYNNALRSFQHKRMEFLEQEILAVESETLWLLFRMICKHGRTLESVTGLAV